MNRLTAKMGGLPVWAWGVLIGAVFVVWMWSKNRAPSIKTAEEPIRETDPFGSISTVGPGNSSNNSANTTDTTSTNSYWASQVQNFLQSQGKVPLTVQTAITKYIRGESLTVEEQALINTALTKYGTPPEGVYDRSPLETKPTATAARYVDLDGIFYRIEKDGSKTPYSPTAWSQIRATQSVTLEKPSANAAADLRRVPTNTRIERL